MRKKRSKYDVMIDRILATHLDHCLNYESDDSGLTALSCIEGAHMFTDSEVSELRKCAAERMSNLEKTSSALGPQIPKWDLSKLD